MQKTFALAGILIAITSMNFSIAMHDRDLDQHKQFLANPDESLLKRPIQLECIEYIQGLQRSQQQDPEAIQAGDSLLALQRQGLVRQPLEKGEMGPLEGLPFAMKRGTHKPANFKTVLAHLDLALSLDKRIRSIKCEASKQTLVPLKLVDDKGTISPALWRLFNVDLNSLKAE